MNTDAKKTVAAVIEGLAGVLSKEADATIEPLMENKEIVNAITLIKEQRYEEFELFFVYPIQSCVESIVKRALDVESESCLLVFLVAHRDFVVSHLEWLFSRYEGHAYSVDKSDTVYSAMIKQAMLGNSVDLNFSYEGQYTFHLPKKILKDPGEIAAFAKAVSELYYGNGEVYCNFVNKFEELES